MKTETLEYMLCIAEKRSISAAAEELNISVSALAKHIRNLEQEFACTLFTRDGRAMALTPSGKIFMNMARTVLYHKNRLEENWHLEKGSL